MELNDAARRIVGQHWRIVLLFIVAGVIAAALLARGPETYTASTRLVLGTGDPETKAESTAIADTARAIATSPTQVQDALRTAGLVGRDSVKIAQHHVSVSALGGSGVVELSVSDRDPNAAAAMADALALRVIQIRRAAASRAQETLASLDKRIAALDRRIQRAEGATRESLVRQRGVAESDRVSLLTATALRPKALIISRARPPRAADPSPLVADALLGALLGVILGLGVAGLIEIVRPTLVGGAVLAADLGTSNLGTLSTETGHMAEDLARVARRLGLVARAAQVETVELLAPDPDVDVEPLAERLESMLPLREQITTEAIAPPVPQSPAHVSRSHRRGAHRHAVRERRQPTSLAIRPFPLDGSSLGSVHATGLALVLPISVKNEELLDVKDLVAATGLPLIGVIAYKRSRTTRGLRGLVKRSGPAAAAPVETHVEHAARPGTLHARALVEPRLTRTLGAPPVVPEDEPGSVGAGH